MVDPSPSLRAQPYLSAGDLIDGAWLPPTAPDGELHVVSPADLDDVIGTWSTSTAHVEVAVQAARMAYGSWRKLPEARRAEPLRAYAKALTARREALTVAIARSIGKPLWEARSEVEAMIAKIEITLGPGMDLIRARALDDIHAVVRPRPIGVCAVIGPFNFPGHLANGHIVPALATGNTVVFKPSERAPEVGELMATCFVEAGFPAGVINVVQGGADVSRALVAHPDLDGVMFTGSTATGRAILAQSAQWPGRLVALELGGKNAAIVLDDADLDHAAREIAFAAYVTAGQRCTATSRVLVTPGAAEGLIRRLTVSARETRVGAPNDDDVFLGPVIDARTVSRVLALAADIDGAYEAVAPVRRAPVEGVRGHYLAPALYVRRPEHTRAHAFDTEEQFAPLLTVEIVPDVGQAVLRANATRYGLAGSVFTADREVFERVSDDLRVGLCNWNRGTVGSSSKLPFGGVGDSGNHRAAGLYSTYYCVDPVAELHVNSPALTTLAPGLRVGT